MNTLWEKKGKSDWMLLWLFLFPDIPTECFLLPSRCNKIKASTFLLRVQRQIEALGCHCCNKCSKSLSQPMFLSPLTWLHDCAGTFMDCLIQCWQIKAKSSQNQFKPIRLWGSQLIVEQKSKHFINNKTLFYFILSPWFNLFPSTFFFFRRTFFLFVKMGFVLMSWAQYWFHIIPGVDIFWSIILQSQHIPLAALKWIYGQPDLGNMEIMKYP